MAPKSEFEKLSLDEKRLESPGWAEWEEWAKSAAPIVQRLRNIASEAAAAEMFQALEDICVVSAKQARSTADRKHVNHLIETVVRIRTDFMYALIRVNALADDLDEEIESALLQKLLE